VTCHVLPVTKGSWKQDNKLMFVQTVNPGIQSIVYGYESSLCTYIENSPLETSPSLLVLVF
jgi:hypothetical protein